MPEIKSTSDQRIENNDPNAVRHNYRILTEDDKKAVTRVKDLGMEFLSLCDSLGSSREISLAKTKIEEAVMWAVKHITK